MPEPTSTAPDEASSARPILLARLKSYRRFWFVAVALYAADQLTKEWVIAKLPYPTFGPPGHIPVVSGFFNLVHVGNTGAAWSMFSGHGEWLALLAALTLVCIYCFRHALGLQHAFAQICFGMLCGGTVGNLTDRLRHNHVVDFLDFHFGNYIYPTFNVADSGIVVGVFAYVIWSLRQSPSPQPPGGG